MNKKNLTCYYQRGTKGCPTCTAREHHERFTFSQEEFEERLYKANPNIRIISKYNGVREPAKFRCLQCGREWIGQPKVYLSGCGCREYNNLSVSKGEVLVASVLKDLGIEYLGQKTFDSMVSKKNLILDFYIPKYNIAIEYDGEQHYSPVKWFGGEEVFQKTIQRDKTKNEYCAKYGIPLLRIPYFFNTYDDVKSQIVTFLNQNGAFVYEE